MSDLADIIVSDPHLLGEVFPWDGDVAAEIEAVRDEAFLVDAALAANGEEFRAEFTLFKLRNCLRKKG